jgi:hypothetical protein
MFDHVIRKGNREISGSKLVNLTGAARAYALHPVFAAPFAPEECALSPHLALQQLRRREFCD